MELPFEKWHGCKNDFLVVSITDADGDVLKEVLIRNAKRLCSRSGDGIGADGILILHRRSKQDAVPDRVTIVNSDGSLAKNCGNGLRCAAASIRRRSIRERRTELELIELTVDQNTFLIRDSNGMSPAQGYEFLTVNMPTPTVGSAVSWKKLITTEVEATLKHNKITAQSWDCVEIGNEHIVIFVSAWDETAFRATGHDLQKLRNGEGVNIHFAMSEEIQARDMSGAQNDIGGQLTELYKVFVWERGSGPTQACGSGACAIAAIVLEEGLTDRNGWIGVNMPGGRLYVKQDDPTAAFQLAGGVQHVFDGYVDI